MKEPIYRTLPVKLTPEEVDQRAREAASVFVAYRKAESQKRAATALYGANMKEHRARLDVLSEAVETQSETRKAECFEHKDYSTGQVILFRCDTNEECSRRRMTAEELQKMLPLDDRGAEVG